MIKGEHVAVLDEGEGIAVLDHLLYLVHGRYHLPAEHLLGVLDEIVQVLFMITEKVADGDDHHGKRLRIRHEFCIVFQLGGREVKRTFALSEAPEVHHDELVDAVDDLNFECGARIRQPQHVLRRQLLLEVRFCTLLEFVGDEFETARSVLLVFAV